MEFQNLNNSVESSVTEGIPMIDRPAIPPYPSLDLSFHKFVVTDTESFKA